MVDSRLLGFSISFEIVLHVKSIRTFFLGRIISGFFFFFFNKIDKSISLVKSISQYFFFDEIDKSIFLAKSIGQHIFFFW